MRGCNIRNPHADAVQIGLEVYRQHNAVTTVGWNSWMEAADDCHALLENEDMGNWICEGLVIVFLTKTLPPTAVVGESEQRGEKRRASVYARARDPSVFRETPGSGGAGERTPKREEGDQVREQQSQLSSSGAFFALWVTL